MRNKFLGTGEPGYHPLRKFAVILAGLRYAVLHDFSVLYKVALSVLVLALAARRASWRVPVVPPGDMLVLLKRLWSRHWPPMQAWVAARSGRCRDWARRLAAPLAQAILRGIR